MKFLSVEPTSLFTTELLVIWDAFTLMQFPFNELKVYICYKNYTDNNLD